VSTSFADYVRPYRVSWLKLPETGPELSSDEDRALYSTFVQRIQAQTQTPLEN